MGVFPGNARASSGGEMDTQKKEGVVRWSHVNFHGTKCTHVHAVN